MGHFRVAVCLGFEVSLGAQLLSGTSVWIHHLHNPIIHLYYPPKRLHNNCLQFLLVHENVPREVENNAYADFWVVKEVYYGICASSESHKNTQLICMWMVVHQDSLWNWGVQQLWNGLSHFNTFEYLLKIDYLKQVITSAKSVRCNVDPRENNVIKYELHDVQPLKT